MSKIIWIGQSGQTFETLNMITVGRWKKITGGLKSGGVGQAEDIDWLENKDEWKNLKSVIMVEAHRQVMGGARTVER